jgi:hypothetical protein
MRISELIGILKIPDNQIFLLNFQFSILSSLLFTKFRDRVALSCLVPSSRKKNSFGFPQRFLHLGVENSSTIALKSRQSFPVTIANPESVSTSCARMQTTKLPSLTNFRFKFLRAEMLD